MKAFAKFDTSTNALLRRFGFGEFCEVQFFISSLIGGEEFAAQSAAGIELFPQTLISVELVHNALGQPLP